MLRFHAENGQFPNKINHEKIGERIALIEINRASNQFRGEDEAMMLNFKGYWWKAPLWNKASIFIQVARAW
ncbi:MAG: hypothetical protein HQL84_15440 [Magnetococcales bacterium]|nr:hypothetical protein [Magnetococcales bacterium]MBF0151414.1 hypothetical protein [Magnetococcales bacterium]MBF0173536.1 hypothetical protein [Magnetococcales bacterium]MBF0348987.1 hypothetical protein [Magnetococcales bacterium]MBF0632430.1 hypothetical protein [Magnetococcales bacterium]